MLDGNTLPRRRYHRAIHTTIRSVKVPIDPRNDEPSTAESAIYPRPRRRERRYPPRMLLLARRSDAKTAAGSACLPRAHPRQGLARTSVARHECEHTLVFAKALHGFADLDVRRTEGHVRIDVLWIGVYDGAPLLDGLNVLVPSPVELCQ